MDNRAYRRVRLRLPVRLRWTTPFGCGSQIAETIDVSRGGLLIAAPEAHLPGSLVWVTFPYDPLAPSAQPEMLASIVRLTPAAAVSQAGNGANGSRPRGIALRIADGLARQAGPKPAHQPERRKAARRRIAVPVLVRPPRIPWFEEAMTLDASTVGLCFVTSREYQPGDALLLRFAKGAPAGWLEAADVRTGVMRVQALTSGVSLAVAAEKSA
jgi:hypothetical protein